MMNFEDWFWSNIGTNITYTIFALIVAIIFVLVLERYFNITLKNPVNLKFDIKDPVGEIPVLKNPMRRMK